MKIEEIKKLKGELETGIRELLWQFTAKTGLHFKEIVLFEEPRIGEQHTQITHIEMKIANSIPDEEGERMKIIDMTGDMTDTEFELIVDEIYERMRDEMYLMGIERIRKMLDKYRSELITLTELEIKYKFQYNGDTFSQILGRIRRGDK